MQLIKLGRKKVTPVYSLTPGGASDGKTMENAIIRIVEQEEKIKVNLKQKAKGVCQNPKAAVRQVKCR